MSCDNSVPVSDIANEVRTLLEGDFITTEDPRINNGVFTNPVLNAPNIRGDIILDRDARSALVSAVAGRVLSPPSVTGGLSDGTALKNLLVALDELGVIVDNTTT